MIRDDANRADGALGPNWLEIDAPAPVIVSNRFSGASTAGVFGGACYVDQFFGPNQSSQITHVSGGYIGVAVLMSPGPNWIGWLSNGDVYRTVAGVSTLVTTLSNWANASARIEVSDGTTYRCYINSVLQHTFIETALTTGQPGILAYGTGTIATGDNWVGAGDVSYSSITAMVEAETSPSTWTDLTGDVIVEPLRWNRGIFGAGPLDRLARPGTFAFSLDNTDGNVAGIADYYTPGHPNALSGWRHGTRVKLTLLDGFVSRVVFRGRLRSISPEPELSGLRMVHCVALDWMDVFAMVDVRGLELRENATSDELIDDLVLLNFLETPPTALFDVGIDVYRYAWDDLGGRLPKATEIAQDILQSELGFLYLRGDTFNGETLVFENRQHRILAEPMHRFEIEDLPHEPEALEVPSTLEHLVNEVEVVTVPRRVDDAATTVLVMLDAPLVVPPRSGYEAAAFEVSFEYRDPENEGEYIGGKDAGAAPFFQYTANDAEDGTGADITAGVSIIFSFSSNGSAAYMNIGNANFVTAYVRGPDGSPVSSPGLEVHGRGIYRYRPVSTRVVNTASVALYGSRPLPSAIYMPYQESQVVGQELAGFLASTFGNLTRRPTALIIANDTPILEAQAIERDVGDCIEVPVDDDYAKMFIHAVEGELTIDGRLRMRYTLAPSDTADVLVLDDAVAGILGDRVLGFA